jgi:putative flippase GtrA
LTLRFGDTGSGTRRMLTIETFARRFGIYCAIGACAFAADYSLFLALRYSNTNLYVANVSGICAGILVSFTLNRKYNFRKSDALPTRAAKFVTVALMGMVVSTLSIVLLVFYGVDDRAAKAISMVLVFGFQFLANALWTFR